MKIVLLGWMVMVGLAHSAQADPQQHPAPSTYACMTWQSILALESMQGRPAAEVTRIQQAHARSREFLQNSSERMQDSLANQNERNEILICAYVDEATQGFSQPCENNEGVEMISQELVDHCLSIRI